MVVAMTTFPTVTRDQMVEIDRLMVESAGISLTQMMENAGRSLATLAIERYAPRRVVVVAGPGGNGGGGLVAARHLANRAVAVVAVLTRPASVLGPVTGRQLAALRWTDVDVADEPPSPPDLVIDAMIGYSLDGAPRGRTAELIERVQRGRSPVLALDTPTGIDVDTGVAHDPAVHADATLTLALPKPGLVDNPWVGALFVADICVPRRVYRQVGVEVPPDLFAASPVVALAEASPSDTG